MQCREFSIMADLSGKENTNVSVPSIGKRHSTNQNEIMFKK